MMIRMPNSASQWAVEPNPGDGAASGASAGASSPSGTAGWPTALIGDGAISVSVTSAGTSVAPSTAGSGSATGIGSASVRRKTGSFGAASAVVMLTWDGSTIGAAEISVRPHNISANAAINAKRTPFQSAMLPRKNIMIVIPAVSTPTIRPAQMSLSPM
jgi:hypothetical protein